MQNLIQAVTPLRGKKGGVSIEKVKDMLKKGTTLSELTILLLNKKNIAIWFLFLTQMKKKRL